GRAELGGGGLDAGRQPAAPRIVPLRLMLACFAEGRPAAPKVVWWGPKLPGMSLDRESVCRGRLVACMPVHRADQLS
ncbi:hypothetical protein, partial [uncultured Corynebacterium sp.]|uniref:hypothetical protein n=1 Tax=uncultured Corynebacterium sp. TaxID=159447 RepID=UPI0025DE44BB